MVMPALLLQRPHRNSKCHDHVKCLERRLPLWHDGNILDLLNEGCSIQHRLWTNKGERSNSEDTARKFANLMFQGKVKAALRFVSDKSRGSFLPISEQVGESTVLEELIKKHPSPSPASSSSLIVTDSTNFSHCHPVIFDCLNDDVIRKVVLRMEGAAGPSGVDARGWRRLCTSFHSASVDLCRSLAMVARRICTSFVDPSTLQPLLNSRLIALDKNPGVRPIGIGETSRRIISKAILSVLKQDILKTSGSLQLCAGQRGGCEAAVHAMREIFNDSRSEGVLLIDASNAFNSLNRRSALLNMFDLCHPFATVLTNIYRIASNLFIDGTSILSREGTTQGDPLAMPM